MGDIELTEKEALVEGEVPAAAAAGDADVVAATQLKLVITLDADMAEWRVVNKNMGLSREQGGDADEARARTSFESKMEAWAESSALETIVILAIVINTFILAIYGPVNKYGLDVNYWLWWADIVLTTIFTVEMVIRIVAMGFSGGNEARPAYISDAWNRLDFVVVIVSWGAIIVDLLQWKVPIKLSTLRALRILRVLKALKPFSGIKVILQTLSRSIAAMGTILGFLVFVFVVAGIVGVQMFKGMLGWRCSTDFPKPDWTGYDMSPGQGTGVRHGHDFPNVSRPEQSSLGKYTFCKPDREKPCNRECAAAEIASPMTPHWTKSDGSTPASYKEYNVSEWRKAEDLPSFTVACPPCFEAKSCDAKADEYCFYFGNTGYGYHAFDNIVMAFLSIFIHMAALYYWEDGYRIGDSEYGLNSEIGWWFAFTIVLVLSYLTVNMFVAVICDTFGAARDNEGHSAFSESKVGIEVELVHHSDRQSKPVTAKIPGMMGKYTVDFLKQRLEEQLTLPSGKYDLVYTHMEDEALLEMQSLVQMEHSDEGLTEENAARLFSLREDVDAGKLDGSVLFSSVLAMEDDRKKQLAEEVQNAELARLKSMASGPADTSEHTALKTSVEAQNTQAEHKFTVDFTSQWDSSIGDMGESKQTWKFNKVTYTVDEETGIVNPVATNIIQVQDSPASDMGQTKIWDFENEQFIECWVDGEAEGALWKPFVYSHTSVTGYVWPESPVDENGQPDPDNYKFHDVIETSPIILALKTKPAFYRWRLFGRFINHPLFDNIIMLFILFNTITLASEHHVPEVQGDVPTMDKETVDVLEGFGLIFNIVFIFEMCAKIIGMGYKNYISIPFNVLDFFIVATSILNMFGDALPGAGAARMLRVFRLFRVARVIRILYKYESMKRLLETVMGSGEAIINLTIFIVFTISVFAIMGLHLFAGVYPKVGGCEDTRYESDNAFGPGNPCAYRADVSIPRRNYESFHTGWLLAFQTLTGDDWCNQMYDHMNVAGAWLPSLFFLANFVMTNYILMNLFVAVILENFEIAEEDKAAKQAIDQRAAWSHEIIRSLHKGGWDISTGSLRISGVEAPKPGEDKKAYGSEITVKGNAADPLRDLILWICECFPMWRLTAKGRIKHEKTLHKSDGKVGSASPISSPKASPESPGEGRPRAQTMSRVKSEENDRKAALDQKQAEALVSRFCHGASREDENGAGPACSVDRGNDTSLFLFSGHYEERYVCQDAPYSDMFADWSAAEVESMDEFDVGKFKPTKIRFWKNPVRALFERIERNPWFERTVMFAILVGSTMLAIEGPVGSLHYNWPEAVDTFAIIGHVFYGIFMFEFTTKLINHGFFFTPDAYLMNSWNRLDFVVVVFATVEYLGIEGLGSLGRVFRLGRTLRPLRAVNKIPSLKVIINACINSLMTNLGVMALAGMLFLIFGILGVAVFGGKFYRCTCNPGIAAGELGGASIAVVGPGAWSQANSTNTSNTGWKVGTKCNSSTLEVNGFWDTVDKNMVDGCNDRLQCQAAAALFPNITDDNGLRCRWKNSPFNFDSIGEAMENMYTAATLAGWTDIMDISADVVGRDKEPQEFASWGAAFYWVAFVFLIAFFITNLFIGVLIDFIRQSDGSALMTEDQQKWADLKRTMRQVKPTYDILRKPKNAFRLWCLSTVQTERWEQLSTSCILGNVFVMAIEFEGQSKEYEEYLNTANNAFLYFFTVELVMKMAALGGSPSNINVLGIRRGLYWTDPWNQFDALVVFGSWAANIFEVAGVQVARALRTFRIAMVLKGPLGKQLRSLFNTLIMSIPPSLNICALMFLQYSIYAILGMQIFGRPHPWTQADAVWNDKGYNVICKIPNDLKAVVENGVSIVRPAYVPEDERCLASVIEFGQVQQTPQSNFHSYPAAMRLLFEISAGKDWKYVMYEVYARAPSTVVVTYFFSFFFFAVYILANLFVAVIVDSFNSCLREGTLSISAENMTVFQKLWKAHSYEEVLLSDSDSTDSTLTVMDNWMQPSERGDPASYLDEPESFSSEQDRLQRVLRNVGRFNGAQALKSRNDSLFAEFVRRHQELLQQAFLAGDKEVRAAKQAEADAADEELKNWISKMPPGIDPFENVDSQIMAILKRVPVVDNKKPEAEMGLALDETDLNALDSGVLVPDPEGEWPLTKNGEVFARDWQHWYEKFRAELMDRERYYSTATQVAKPVKPGDKKSATEKRAQREIQYEAVMEALVLMQMGKEQALTADEKKAEYANMTNGRASDIAALHFAAAVEAHGVLRKGIQCIVNKAKYGDEMLTAPETREARCKRAFNCLSQVGGDDANAADPLITKQEFGIVMRVAGLNPPEKLLHDMVNQCGASANETFEYIKESDLNHFYEKVLPKTAEEELTQAFRYLTTSAELPAIRNSRITRFCLENEPIVFVPSRADLEADKPPDSETELLRQYNARWVAGTCAEDCTGLPDGDATELEKAIARTDTSTKTGELDLDEFKTELF